MLNTFLYIGLFICSLNDDDVPELDDESNILNKSQLTVVSRARALLTPCWLLLHIAAIDLLKEVWVGATFFWKMVDILSKGIFSACNNLDCSRFRRGSAADFTSNS